MNKSEPLAVAFGEALFDCFEDQTCIGGAALNFAWNLSQFGISVAFVSAIGEDELGKELRQFLSGTDIDQTLISERQEPTGTVDVRLVQGEPEFTINRNVAWDHIELPEVLDVKPALVYFGTIAQRTERNRATLRRLLDLNPRHRFFDVNLRPGHDSTEVVLEGLRRRTILKLNEEEWEVIRRISDCEMPVQLLERFDLDLIALTRGEEGAELYVPGGSFSARSGSVPVVDTVGAGDAFSAALAAGVMVGADPARIVEVACAAGAAVVQQRGAQIDLPDEVVSAFEMDEKKPG